MRILIVLGILVCSFTGCKQDREVRDVTLYATDLPRRKGLENHEVPDLDSLKQGIEVVFSENPVSVPPVQKQRDGFTRYWSYSVSVESRTRIEIDYWGVIERKGFNWRHRGFSRTDFAEVFGCPDGRLEPGERYTYKTASEVGSMPGKVQWYFVGVDSEGNATKGQATVTSEAPK